MSTEPLPKVEGQQIPRCPFCDEQMAKVNFYSWQTSNALALAMFCMSCGKLLGQEIMMITGGPEPEAPPSSRIHRVS